jgi:hypothetical protein
MKRKLNLQLFGDGDGEGTTGTAGKETSRGGNYSYEQAEEIATARAERAEKAALSNFFAQQGMSKQEAEEAFKDYKAKKAASKPDVSALEKERDEAKTKLAALENQNLLRGKKVREEDIDYVTFKVGQMVDDKTDFNAAADKFLKDNPRYREQTGIRVSTGVSGNGNADTRTSNEKINDALKAAFKGNRR